ncbi:MAG: choice-of-anchor J domain-containing protein [Chitinophagaceae bacterium]|nr:choice-of-anchor J domain-containing protein [Chitinophagaceae bacterium]
MCIDWGVIDLACGSPFNGVYDGGRTLVHEIGHYFYLWHIWGDENGCTGDDFRIQDGFPLSANCTDDTPNQAKSTSGCLSGVQTDGCSSTAPGFMYQNYMDYTNDGCYGMFTIAQVCRMQACLDNYRASLKSSNGCAPVVAVNNDVRVSEILNPVSRGFACGKKTSYCDLQLTPQVLIVNDGDAPLTSLTFTIRVDNVVVGVQNWTGNLATSEFAYVNIDAFTPPTGTHTLKINTGNPNGGIDGRPINDFAEARYEILPPALNPPIAAQSFEEVTFPPDNWRVINPDGGITWAKTTSAGNPGIASARLSAYSYNSKQQIDYLLTPKIQTAGSEFLILNFNLAYAKYNNDMENWDQLEVVYSEDCGIT